MRRPHASGTYVGPGHDRPQRFHGRTCDTERPRCLCYKRLGGVDVANNVLYSAMGNRIFALKPSSGHKIWIRRAGGGFEFSPTVVNGVAYVGSTNGVVYALNASTGTTVWTYKTGGMVESSTAVAHGVVYVSSDDGNLYALKASTGAKVWRFHGGSGSPAIVNGVVYVGGGSECYALKAPTGTVIWSRPIPGCSTPAVANQLAFITSGTGGLYALDASTGAKIWQRDLTGGAAVPTIVNGVVYVAGGKGSAWSSPDNRMYALRAEARSTIRSQKIIAVRQSTPTDGVVGERNVGTRKVTHTAPEIVGRSKPFLNQPGTRSLTDHRRSPPRRACPARRWILDR